MKSVITKKKHTLQGIIISLFQMGVIFYLLSLFLGKPVFSQALGVETAVFHVGLVAFAMLYSPVSLVTGLILNFWSRKNEYQADEFACKFFNAKALGNALKKLSINNLSNLTPPSRLRIFLLLAPNFAPTYGCHA